MHPGGFIEQIVEVVVSPQSGQQRAPSNSHRTQKNRTVSVACVDVNRRGATATKFMRVLVCVCVCVCVCVYVYVYIYAYVYVYVYAYVCMGLYLCMHACLYVYMSICLYVLCVCPCQGGRPEAGLRVRLLTLHHSCASDDTGK